MIPKPLVLFAALALAFVAPAAITPAAQAQFGVYGLFSVENMSGIQSSPLTIAGTLYNNSVNPIGGTVGIFYDFKTFGPVRLGVDARGVIETDHRGAQATSNGSGTRVQSGLAGVRASFHTPILALKPYAELAAGIGRSNYGFLFTRDTTTNTGDFLASNINLVNNLEYHIYAGVDVKVLPVMDWRAVELSYGGLDSFGTNSHNYPLKSVSTGVVFHFPTF